MAKKRIGTMDAFERNLFRGVYGGSGTPRKVRKVRTYEASIMTKDRSGMLAHGTGYTPAEARRAAWADFEKTHLPIQRYPIIVKQVT